MATEQAWGDYGLQAFVATGDTLLLGTATDTIGARCLGTNIVARRSSGGPYTAQGNVVLDGGAAGTDTRMTVGNAASAFQFGVTSANETFLLNNTAVPMLFFTNSVERMRITASGGLAVGTTTVAGGVVQISGQTSNTNGVGLDQGQLLITDTDNPNDSGLMIGYRFDPMVDEYGRLQARNSLGPVAIAIQPGGGRVGIGISGVNQSAVLEVASTTGGFLPPRMTTAQRDAISSPANGLVLYNSTTNKLQVRAAGAWVDLH